jgi:hypothetical protein
MPVPDPLSLGLRLAATVQVEDISGSHFALIQEPAMERLTAALLQLLSSEPTLSAIV